ncbi:MAG: hypothetical protein RJB34_1250 [Pseudomonadota bacterium]|jgi:O-antigen ligase
MNHAPSAYQARPTGRWRDAPLVFKVLAVGMLSSYLPLLLPGGMGGELSFLGWMIPLLGCGLVALERLRRVRFPLKLWLPWVLWVLVYALFAEAENALQRSVMLLTPLVVGAAFSTLWADAALVIKFAHWVNRFFWVFLVAAGVSTGLLVSGRLADTTGFAAGAITASLLATWYAARYSGKDHRALYYWAALALVPVLANTRTGMVAVALTLPLTLCPLPMKKRLLAVLALAVAGALLFQTERIQSKMFFSGQGTLADVVAGVAGLFGGEQATSGNFATSGRKSMNDALVAKLDQSYWFGFGANTTEAVSLAIAGVTHPHNDWLRLWYEYGLLGLLIFAAAMLMQMRHAYRGAHRNRSSPAALLLYVGAGSFIPMAIFMGSDNVMLYAAWFGNLQFAILGLGYAALHARPLRHEPRLAP